jgi:hypothetical protein
MFGFRHAVAAMLCLTLLAATAVAQDTDKTKRQKKRAEATKVELKDVPPAVAEAAKKELPNATWSSAEKTSAKKQGTLYVLEGKDGKYAVSVTMTSSGELQRLSKGIERKRKKAK